MKRILKNGMTPWVLCAVMINLLPSGRSYGLIPADISINEAAAGYSAVILICIIMCRWERSYEEGRNFFFLFSYMSVFWGFVYINEDHIEQVQWVCEKYGDASDICVSHVNKWEDQNREFWENRAYRPSYSDASPTHESQGWSPLTLHPTAS